MVRKDTFDVFIVRVGQVVRHKQHYRDKRKDRQVEWLKLTCHRLDNTLWSIPNLGFGVGSGKKLQFRVGYGVRWVNRVWVRPPTQKSIPSDALFISSNSARHSARYATSSSTPTTLRIVSSSSIMVLATRFSIAKPIGLPSPDCCAVTLSHRARVLSGLNCSPTQYQGWGRYWGRNSGFGGGYGVRW